ncbi:acyl-CoA dehydrogenase family protein [Novosphingobium malaysiense]|uniref:acyl-CoA dehydrogenase family protein n=1 Tax=Novosphingobium malaysiense TaxID=1348853 RepID=UPI00068CC086|nr:acyl-CoA dehydrogenase family protein [Novosphingobium malaysiense]
MYLAPEGDELEIVNAASDFLVGTTPISRLHEAGCADLAPSAREAFGEMGWFALAVPEEQGGSGLSAVEHTLFFREAGRQCAPVDLLAQCLLANADLDSGLREDVIAGTAGAALLVPSGASWRLLGSSEARWALLVERTGGAVYSMDAIALQERPALDPTNSLHVAESLPQPMHVFEGPTVWQLGQLAVAAMLVGIAETALDLIVEYAKVRETFGRKIGSYQAVRHPCADMAVRTEAARSQLWYAATAAKEERADAQVHLDAAKHLANLAAMSNSDTSIQLHGGIGVTDEHDCHLLLKHAMTLSRLFGGKRDLLGRLLKAQVAD